MNELVALAINYLRGMWRYRWQGLVVAWILVLPGWFWVYSQPDVYKATAQVYVDTQSILKPLLRGLAVETDVMSQVNLMSRALLSRPQLEKVARETDLDLRADTPAKKEILLERLKAKVLIAQGRKDNVFTIEYEDNQPRMAHAVVQTLLGTLMEDALGLNRTDTSNAQRFLEKQIKDYEHRLAEAEQRLSEFKKEHIGLMPGEEGDYYDRLQAEMTKLTAARQKLTLASERRDELTRQLEGQAPMFNLGRVAESGGGRGPTSLDQQIAQYEQQLSQALLKYTDKHPDVVALRETLDRLNQQRQQEIASTVGMSGLTGPDPLDQNPVYQSIKIALSTSEVEVATLRSEVQQQEAKVAELRRRVDAVLEAERQFKQLNRDYGATKAQYDALLSRLESARLSEEAQTSTDDIKFQIIEPPQVPIRPIGPNRFLMLTAVLMAALAAGAGVAFVVFHLRPVFNSREALGAVTGLPVLGVVSMALNDGEKIRMRLATGVFCATSALLVVAYGGAVLMEEQGVQWVRALAQGSPLT